MKTSDAHITKTAPRSCHLLFPVRKNSPTAVIHHVQPKTGAPTRQGNDKNWMNNAFIEILRYIFFLFSPEDSGRVAMDERANREWSGDLLSARTRVDIKAVFWIMASILISIELARFCG